MSALTLDFVLRATGGTAWRAGATSFTGVDVDGRAVPRGGLWFAIRGERHDGHRFASQAILSGATGLVVEKGRAGEMTVYPEHASIVEVDDTTRALGALARAWRSSLPSLRVAGVTGSNGKTTTKELLAAILAAHAGDVAVHKTEGNFNNHIGLPLTLLKLAPHHRFAVIEMGMSARGEIAYLASLARPDVGVIVNAGPVHLETLGTVDNVARAKGELFAALGPAGAAVYPDGDLRLAAQAEASPAVRHLRFGERPGVDVRIVEATVAPGPSSAGTARLGTHVRLRLPDGAVVRAHLAAVGLHNAANAAAAAGVAFALGVGPDAIAAGLARATMAKHRSTVVAIGGRHVLDDCYNASPLSTPAGLDALVALQQSGGGDSIAVLGDMLELGPDAAMLHRSVGAHAARVGVARLLAYGPHAADVVAGAVEGGLSDASVMPDHAAIVDALLRRSNPGDWVLVKGSRGMQLERVLDGLKLAFAASQQSTMDHD